MSSKIDSVFLNTAELVGVRLYEEDGTPYTGGAWSLQSANGINYRVLSVPEVSTELLSLLGPNCVRRTSVETNLTVLATCRRQGRVVLDYLTDCHQAAIDGGEITSILPAKPAKIQAA